MGALLKLFPDQKACTKCQAVKPLTDFYRNKKYYNAECKECHKADCRERNAWNRTDKYYDGYYKKRFGISFAEVNSMLAMQNGLCANLGCSCEIAIHPTENQKKAIVDHCHETGRVRSLMCQRCNTTLGHVENTKAVVLGLFDYLNKHNSKR